MGYERRPGGIYYYRKKRVGKRVISEYIGAGELSYAAYTLDQVNSAQRRLEATVWKQERARMLQDDEKARNSLNLLQNSIENELERAGYHKVRGRWRKKRIPQN